MQHGRERDFFTGRGEVPRQYPWMAADEDCEVVVVGGGLTGCFAVWQLARAGIDAVLLSSKPIGFSSSMVSHSAMGWQNDLLFTRLAQTVGKDRAGRTWSLCRRALDELEEFSRQADGFEFRRRDAFLYVSDPEECDVLHVEYLMRKHNGFDVEYLSRQEAGERFSFDLQAGVLAPGAAAECDGYRLCHALVSAAETSGARIYENTTVLSAGDTDTGRRIEVHTDTGRILLARKLVLAIGWRQENCLPALVTRRTQFGIVTDPLPTFAGYESRPLVRNASERVSLRSTADGRALACGLDCTLPERDGRLSRLFTERLAERKYAELEARAEGMLCGVGELTTAYTFRNSYALTRDGLPIVGRHLDHENVWVDLMSGANGGLCALLAGQMLAELYRGGSSEIGLFSPVRATLG